jgi:acyl dehydratase
VDPHRPDTREGGPFGGTVAHGYLTLPLLIPLWTQILTVHSVHTKVNYGLGKVRFPAPVPAGSRVRATAALAALDDIPEGAQLTIDATIERDGGVSSARMMRRSRTR